MKQWVRPLPLFQFNFDRTSSAVFLDFDGTLVEIADRPQDIVVPASLPTALRALDRALGGALAIVSGRAIDVIDAFLGAAVPAVAGLHGWEQRTHAGLRSHAAERLPDLGPARRRLDSLCEEFPGVLIEDKGASLAIHYRKAPAAAKACHDLAADIIAAAKGTLVTLDGKCLVEVKTTAASKGSAVRTFMTQSPFAGRKPIYIGDDITDEAGFTAVREAGGTAVAVGERAADPRTAATACLPDVAAVNAWIETVAGAARTAARG